MTELDQSSISSLANENLWESRVTVGSQGVLTLGANSFASRNGMSHLDYLGDHFDPDAMPGKPYPGLFEVKDGKMQKVPIPRRMQPVRPVDAEGGKLWSLTTAKSECETKLERKLDSLDVPLFMPTVDSKDAKATLAAARSGDDFFATCDKAWKTISRDPMQKEWRAAFTADKSDYVPFEEGWLCPSHNDKELPQLYGNPEMHRADDLFEERPNNIIATSETREPIILAPEQQQKMLKRLAVRMAKRQQGQDGDTDGDDGKSSADRKMKMMLYAHLQLFTHALHKAQQALDDACRAPVGRKHTRTPHRDYLVLLDAHDVCVQSVGGARPRPSDSLVALVEQQKANVHTPSLTKAASGDHDNFTWSQLRIPERLHEQKRGPALKDFYAAHNKNVDAFSALLADPKKAQYTVFSAWDKLNYSARLRSDILIRHARQTRHDVEGCLSELRDALYTEEKQLRVRDRLEARSFTGTVKEGVLAMQKELDEYNLEHVAKINTKIQKRVAKYNEKLGFTPPDQNVKRNSARGDKSLRMMNENGVPHNLKYGKWHFGKVHTFRGNITCSPVAGTPVVSGTTVIKPVSALQYAFLDSTDIFHVLANCSTISNTYEGCRVSFNLKKGMCTVSASRGSDTLSRELPVTKGLLCEGVGGEEELVFKWACKSSDYLEEHPDLI